MQAIEVVTKSKWTIDPVHSTIGCRLKHLKVLTWSAFIASGGVAVGSDLNRRLLTITYRMADGK